ncbi:hypothetical protein [Leekyejoonella antrihumi]|uniref:Uncharacterized protein n=1 Tax=Leekyejoonella antrihumi TaxID=1660198 RepID=A0A563DVL6_9MICO|nr:hypothetical protein [Leekyejoonella antrihumi]TWP34235.1 hypothetical protein FGL98_18420 [Leekyejoonella antrihumi]
MSDDDIRELIHQAGAHEPAPDISLTSIAARVKSRRRRYRSIFSGAALIAVVGATVAGTLPGGYLRGSGPGPSQAAGAPVAVGVRPACPPDPGTVHPMQPSLASGRFGPTIALNPSTREITFDLNVPPSKFSDRYIMKVQLIMVTAKVAESKTAPGIFLADPANQVAKVAVSRPVGDQHIILSVPPNLPSGTYAIYYWARFPGPSLCGQQNPDPPTVTGVMHRLIATATVP